MVPDFRSRHYIVLDFLTYFFKIFFLSTGDVKLTQTNAILRHISRKHGLDGKTDAEKDRVDLMENEVMDFRNGFVRLSYNPDFVSFLSIHSFLY
jgi:hypothetical protein